MIGGTAFGWYDYGFRFYDPQIARWHGIDQHCENYISWSPYHYGANNPIRVVELDGMDYYYTEDGKYLGQDDKKTQNVYAVKSDSYTKQENTICVMADGMTQIMDNKGNAMTHDQFKDLAGTLYAEATKGSEGSWEESAAIYSVLENRGNADSKSTHDEAQTGGVNGWSKRGGIDDKKANSKDVQNAYKGLIRGALDSNDYSNGAYFWDGTDFASTPRYTQGTTFTDPSHNIWDLKDNAKAGKNSYGTWQSVYETTNASGKTTFSKLTDSFLSTRYPKKKAGWKGN